MRVFKNKLYIIILLWSFTLVSTAQVFTENFESGIPNTWAVFDIGVGTGISWDSTLWGGTNTAAYIMYDCSVVSDSEDWLVTPQITPLATDNFLRFFQTDPDISDYGSVMTIRVSTQSQTNPADFTTIYTQGESVLTPSLVSHQIDLSTYANQPIYIAFVMTQNCGDRWVIDNVEVRSECSIDLSVTAAGNILTANQTGATYEWMACGGIPITGETNQSITVTDPLQYFRVNITTPGGCSEFSGCYSVYILGVEDNKFKEKLTLYPNPVNHSFQVENLSQQVDLSIYDISGKKLVNLLNYEGNIVDVSNLNEGMYMVKVSKSGKEQILKLLKN